MTEFKYTAVTMVALRKNIWRNSKPYKILKCWILHCAMQNYDNVHSSLPVLSWVELFIQCHFLTARVLWATDWAPGNGMKDESSPDLKTLGFEPGTQWFEVECSTARPSAPHMIGIESTSMDIRIYLLIVVLNLIYYYSDTCMWIWKLCYFQ